MRRPVRHTIALVAAILVSLAFTAGCAASSRTRHGGTVTASNDPMMATGNTLKQAVPGAAAATRLVDQDGRSFTLHSMRGQVVVLAPVLTMCQETCPMTTANMHLAAERARAQGGSDRVVFLELTVDPERDTVRRLHAYAKLYGALSDWRLATGDPAHVKRLWKALGVSTEKTKPDDTVRDWLTGRTTHHSYDVHHQDVVMILDAVGRIRWVTVGRPDAHTTRLPTTLMKFLNDEGRANLAHPNDNGASSWTAHDLEQAVDYVRALNRDG